MSDTALVTLRSAAYRGGAMSDTALVICKRLGIGEEPCVTPHWIFVSAGYRGGAMSDTALVTCKSPGYRGGVKSDAALVT